MTNFSSALRKLTRAALQVLPGQLAFAQDLFPACPVQPLPAARGLALTRRRALPARPAQVQFSLDLVIAPAVIATPRKKTILAPRKSAPESIYEYLVQTNKLKHLTSIALRAATVPDHLLTDAALEIQAAWANQKLDATMQPSQIYQYAALSGRHAGLKARRGLSAVVAIPGTLFKRGCDTDFAKSIGAAVNPNKIDDMLDSSELAYTTDEAFEPTNRQVELQMGKLNLKSNEKAIVRSIQQTRSAETTAEVLGLKLTYVLKIVKQIINSKNLELCPA